MVGYGVKAMKLVYAVSDRIGERIFLCIERAGLDAGDGFGEIAAHRDGAEQFERSGLDLARQHADAHAF